MTKTATSAKLVISGVLLVFLAACGGGGGGDSAPTSTVPDTSSNPSVTTTSPPPIGTTPTVTPLPVLPENQPWKSLFAPGVDKLTLRATGCIGTFSNNSNPAISTNTSAINAMVTISLGSTTMSVKVAAQSLTFPAAMLVGDSTDSNYNLTLPSGTRTVLNELRADSTVGSEKRVFVVRVNSSNVSKQDLIYTYDNGVATTSLVCRAGLINTITTNAVNVSLPERLKLFMQNSQAATVTSPAAGCPALSGRSVYSYSLNKNGEIKFNDVLLPADWLNGAGNINSLYEEYSTFEPSGKSNTVIAMHNNKFEGVTLFSTISRDPSFSHRCYP
jgi:hypothetical protein